MNLSAARQRPLGALAGALAFTLSATVVEFIAALAMAVSPHVAVGDAVIRATPGAVVHFATSVFGTYDKPLLLGTIALITLVYGALTGIASLRRPKLSGYAFTLWWAVVTAAVWTDQTMLLAAAVGVGTAAVAGWRAHRLMLRRIPTDAAAIETTSEAVAIEAGDPRVRTPDRRAFLTFAGATAGASVVATFGAQRLGTSRVDIELERRSVTLPAASQTLPPVPRRAALDTPGITPLVTPNDQFYRIDKALSVPRVDVQKWRLRIMGMVDRPQEFTYAELAAMPAHEADVTLTCVSNEIGGKLLGNARWLGIPLSTLLERAGVQAGATQIVGRSVDRFTVGFPTETALDGRASMVALGMNGAPLPAQHGFPARLVVPGLYGYVSATKWLSELELTTLEAFDAYWIPRGWAKEGPIKTQSRIDVPASGRTVQPGRTAIAGVAWAGIRSVSKVEVRVLPSGAQDAPWLPARLGDALSQSTWRQWTVEWDAQPGDYELTVRATDGAGETQTSVRTGTSPSGATGWHQVRVKVRA